MLISVDSFLLYKLDDWTKFLEFISDLLGPFKFVSSLLSLLTLSSISEMVLVKSKQAYVRKAVAFRAKQAANGFLLLPLVRRGSLRRKGV